MILNFTSANFALDTEVYYSTPFTIETNDTLMSIEVHLAANGSTSLQQSLDGNTWYDITDTTITCAPYGMQSFIECQPKLQFRLKSAIEFISANILL
jgi:hypothetical protein